MRARTGPWLWRAGAGASAQTRSAAIKARAGGTTPNSLYGPGNKNARDSVDSDHRPSTGKGRRRLDPLEPQATARGSTRSTSSLAWANGVKRSQDAIRTAVVVHTSCPARDRHM